MIVAEARDMLVEMKALNDSTQPIIKQLQSLVGKAYQIEQNLAKIMEGKK